MTLYVLALAFCLTGITESLPKPLINMSYGFPFVSREGWGARPPRLVTELNTTVPYVIIHHSYTPGACHTKKQCVKAMQIMQDMHQINNKWVDIGYNFAVGSDGVVYEGRGWNAAGAHATGYNTASIGIVMIGDWRFVLPPRHQLQTVKMLIEKGVELGYISKAYDLIGHRQVRLTECPGDALFNEISTWERFQNIIK